MAHACESNLRCPTSRQCSKLKFPGMPDRYTMASPFSLRTVIQLFEGWGVKHSLDYRQQHIVSTVMLGRWNIPTLRDLVEIPDLRQLSGRRDTDRRPSRFPV